MMTKQGSAVPVMKKTGERRKINMSVCASCSKRFIIKGALSNSIHLSDYRLMELPLSSVQQSDYPAVPQVAKPVNETHDKAGVAKEMVNSKNYGSC